MVILLEVKLKTVAILGGICAVRTSILIYVGMRLHMRIQHALVYTSVVTFGTFEGFGAEVVS